MEPQEQSSTPPEVAVDSLGFFRWGRIAGKVLVTNDAGEWIFLSEAEFNDLLAGRIGEDHPRAGELRRKDLLREGLDLDGLTVRVTKRSRHVTRGPHLHVVTVTGGEQANAAGAGKMTAETAEKVVDLALQSPSAAMTFELRGHAGEPLLNFDVVRHLIETARARNQRGPGKTLTFRLVSNLTAMTEDAAEWLIANDVLLATSFDGPASVHDRNRQWRGGSVHAEVVRWLESFNRRYEELGRDQQIWRVEALLTTTRGTLEAWREVVDEYVLRGLSTIRFRPLSPVGVAPDLWTKIGYSAAEYLTAYRHAVDYILELNRKGVEIAERTAAVFATKILTSDDPGVVDLQSPNGAGTAEIAYDADGRVFPCDEARLLSTQGEPMFELGDVGGLTVPDVLRHSTVRAIAAASLLDSQPMCADCWNKPYCGIDPVHNFATGGDLFGQRPNCLPCRMHMDASTKIFEILADESDVESSKILKRWAATPNTSSDRVSAQAP